MILLMIALQFSTVQTFVSKKITSYLSKELDSKISLERVYFKPFSAFLLEDFTMQDYQGDTILFANRITASFDLLHFLDNKITVNDIKLQDAYLNFHIYKDSTNFSKYIKYFSATHKKTSQPKKSLQLDLQNIDLKNSRFKLVNHNFKHPKKGVNFADLDITALNLKVSDIKFGDVLKAHIENISLKEKSGLLIKKLTTKASYAKNQMEFLDLHLVTNRSELKDYVRFEYDSIAHFTDFINKVHVVSQIEECFIDSKDIAFFAPTMEKVVFETAIAKASLNGTVANINAKDVLIKTSKETELEGKFTIIGLPYINKTIFDFDLKHLKTTATDIEKLVPNLANRKEFSLPAQLHQLKNIDFIGKFKGLYNDFNVEGDFHTALGKINTNTNIDIVKSLKYNGKVNAVAFNIAEIANTKALGKTNFALNFKGQNLALEDLSLHFSGTLNNSYIQNYTYNQIDVDGTIQNQTLDIQGNVLDPNLNLGYQATIDWTNSTPTYLLQSKIKHAYINKLHWINKDSITIHNAIINTNLVGNTLNSIVGNFTADSVSFSSTKGSFNLDAINFVASKEDNLRKLKLNSDAVDAEMTGIIDLNTIVPYFRSLAMRYAPAINIETSPYNPQNFDLNINIKEFKPIAAFLDPTLTLDDGAHLNAKFSSEDFMARFIAYSPLVYYKGIKITNLAFQENADEHSFTLNTTADRISFSDSTYINNIAITNKLAKDSLHFNIELSQKQATNYLNLDGNIHFRYGEPALAKLNPSTIIINKENWQVNQNALLSISKGKLHIQQLSINQNDQFVHLNGLVSNENDILDIKFENFNLASLHGITNPLGIELKGTMNGLVSVSSVLKNPFADANIKTSPIIYNKIPVGQLNLDANYDPFEKIMNLDISLLDLDKRGISAKGHYNFNNTNDPLYLKGNLNETELILFQPFLKNLVSNLQGKANAEIEIKGKFNNPKISGIGRFSNAQFKVNYLKTDYFVDQQMAMVDNNNILLSNFQIQDINKSIATANGFIDLSRLAAPYIDIDVVGNNFMILNTTFKDNNLYYGTAKATGNFKFKGQTSSIDIDITAKSEQGTIINIPFNSAMTVAESDFIYFVSKDSTENQKREERSLFKGLTMNIDLTLTPDAEVNLQTSLGSLKGNGHGEISMRISTLGDFEMFGDYAVNKGKFHFTAQDFINKYFDIKEGGTIRWTGNPSEAIINLNAIYQQRTAIGPLYNAAGRAGEDERVLAQADMLIKGTLEQPDITFDLNFPQNPYIKDQLQSFLSDVNNVNQQALSLIVRRSFTPSSTNEIGKEVNNTLLSAGTEIAFNQLNNIISQSLNINFFDLNIRSLNDASASVRLLDDRLILTGGITDRNNYLANDLTFFREGVATDAELTYRLKKDGNLLFRAYNRPYTRNFLIRSTDAEYISAIGLVYRQEFNSIQEFWRRLIFWTNKNKQNNKK